MIAAFISLHPELALRTLLHLDCLCMLKEQCVLLQSCVADAILLAGHASVGRLTTLNAPELLATWAVERLVTRVGLKDTAAVRRRAVVHVRVVLNGQG